MKLAGVGRILKVHTFRELICIVEEKKKEFSLYFSEFLCTRETVKNEQLSKVAYNSGLNIILIGKEGGNVGFLGRANDF